MFLRRLLQRVELDGPLRVVFDDVEMSLPLRSDLHQLSDERGLACQQRALESGFLNCASFRCAASLCTNRSRDVVLEAVDERKLELLIEVALRGVKDRRP